MDWILVRRLGELQVLTRASYLLLIVVPFLAAIWQLYDGIIGSDVRDNIMAEAFEIHNSVSEFEKLVNPSKPDDDSHYIKLNTISRCMPEIRQADMVFKEERADMEKYFDLLRSFEACITNGETSAPGTHITAAKDILNQAISAGKLRQRARNISFPVLLASTFFASLMVALGQLVYQLFAPQIVKSQQRDEYALKAMKQQAEYPDKEMLAKARKIMEEDGYIFHNDDTGTMYKQRISFQNSRFIRVSSECLNQAPVDENDVSNESKKEPSSVASQDKENTKQEKVFIPSINIYMPYTEIEPSAKNSYTLSNDHINTLQIIGDAAKREYDYHANTKFLFVLISSAFYVIGLLFLLVTLLQQAKVIADISWGYMSV